MWLAGGLLLAWVAGQNLASADRVVTDGDPAFRLRLKPFGQEAGAILKLHAADQNRRLYGKWELYQLFLGSFFFCVMLFGSREDKFALLGVLAMLLLVALQRFLLTPELHALGRLIDHSPTPSAPDQNRFWITNMAHIGVEVAKDGLALLLAAQMIVSRKRSGRSRDARRKLNRVDEPYYRGVNR
jgi:hypothetical protein